MIKLLKNSSEIEVTQSTQLLERNNDINEMPSSSLALTASSSSSSTSNQSCDKAVNLNTGKNKSKFSSLNEIEQLDSNSSTFLASNLNKFQHTKAFKFNSVSSPMQVDSSLNSTPNLQRTSRQLIDSFESPITSSKSKKRHRESSNALKIDLSSSTRKRSNTFSHDQSAEVICLESNEASDDNELNFLNETDDVDTHLKTLKTSLEELNIRKKIHLRCFNCDFQICDYTTESRSDTVSRELEEHVRDSLRLTFDTLSLISDPIDQSFCQVNTVATSLNGWFYLNCKQCLSLIGLKPNNIANKSFLTNYIDKFIILNL